MSLFHIYFLIFTKHDNKKIYFPFLRRVFPWIHSYTPNTLLCSYLDIHFPTVKTNLGTIQPLAHTTAMRQCLMCLFIFYCKDLRMILLLYEICSRTTGTLNYTFLFNFCLKIKMYKLKTCKWHIS